VNDLSSPLRSTTPGGLLPLDSARRFFRTRADCLFDAVEDVISKFVPR